MRSTTKSDQMERADLKKIESEEEMVQRLRGYRLFREDDVTFEDLGDGMYVYVGDGFHVDAELFDAAEISALLVEGSVNVDRLVISDILSDIGVFCVTGDVRCRDMDYRTESTGVAIGGTLTVGGILYADCGNSVLQVNGDLTAKLLFNSQCSIEVAGETNAEFDEEVSAADLATMGMAVEEGQDADDMVSEYFNDGDDEG